MITVFGHSRQVSGVSVQVSVFRGQRHWNAEVGMRNVEGRNSIDFIKSPLKSKKGENKFGI